MGWLKEIIDSFRGSWPTTTTRHVQSSSGQRSAESELATLKLPSRKPAASGGTRSSVIARPPKATEQANTNWPRARVASSSAQKVRGIEWMGPGKRVHLKDLGLHLVDPLVYFSDGRSGVSEPAAIDFSLPVSRESHSPTGRELSYWPRYDGLTPGQRRYFLEWLAGGRRQIPAELGYTFLFVYHLERRALIDEADQLSIFKEIVRLRQLYIESSLSVSRSFDSYTGSFLWFLVVREPALFPITAIRALCETTRFWTQDNLACAFYWFSKSQTPLPDWFASQIGGELPKSQQSVVLKRVGEEFTKLFGTRFRERFPRGMELPVPTQTRQYAYRPASAALPSLTIDKPNPLSNHAPLNSLSELWNECIADLRKLSNVVGKDGHEKLSVASWEAMPAEIRSGVEHPLTEALCETINECSDESGMTILTASKLAKVLCIEDTAKLTLPKSRRLSETASHIGYCVEPDARLTGRPYRSDEPIAVFLNSSDAQPDPIRYSAAACMLTVGMAVAAADGAIQSDEVSILTQQVEAAFELNDAELRRLEILRSLIIERGADLAVVSRLAKKLTHEQRNAVGKLILVLVTADNVVTPEELKAVRKLYATLGFERGEIERAISSLSTADDPITVVAPGEAGAGEALPPPPSNVSAKGLALNHDAIAAIMKDTQEVARMLATAMNISLDSAPADPSPVVPSTPAATISEPVGRSGSAVSPEHPRPDELELPQRYATFYQLLITRSEWPYAEAESLAQQHGHMLSGALETLNDWAFERFGGQLFVDDGERVVVEKSYLG